MNTILYTENLNKTQLIDKLLELHLNATIVESLGVFEGHLEASLKFEFYTIYHYERGKIQEFMDYIFKLNLQESILLVENGNSRFVCPGFDKLRK